MAVLNHMLIAIDGNEANLKKRVGVNRYAFEIIRSFHRIRKTDPEFKELTFRIFLSGPPLADLPAGKSWWQYEVFGPKPLWTWTGLIKRLYFGNPRPTILFTPSHYGPLISPIPFVVSIMDLGFLRWQDQFTRRDLFQLKYWTKLSVRRADRIVAISEFTKKDLVDTYGIRPEKIIVAYPGFRKAKKHGKVNKDNILSVLKKYHLEGEYIFYLGTLKPSKNIEGLIDAYQKLIIKHQLPDLKLVIAGKKGWLYQNIFRKIKELKIENKVVFTGFIPEEEAEILMARAEVFVMPSFWEGFGIPILEAMAAGVPVVSSNRGALPEVASNAALLTDPENYDEIADSIWKVLSDQKLRQKLIKSGKMRIRKFDWQESGRLVLRDLVNLSK